MNSYMNRNAKCLLAILLLLLVGCNTFPPYVPKQAQSSFAKLVREASASRDPSQWSIENVDVALTRLKTIIQDAGNEKHEQEWDYGSASTGGGLAAAIGQLASKTGLLNSGLFVLLGGQTMDKLYAPATTKLLHVKMVDMLICMEERLHTISQHTIDQAKQDTGSLDNDPSLGYTAVGMIIQEIDQGLAIYRQSILKEGVNTVSKSDFMRFLGDFRDAENGQAAAAKRMAALNVPGNLSTANLKLLTNQASAQQAQADLRTLKVGLEACTKSLGVTG